MQPEILTMAAVLRAATAMAAIAVAGAVGCASAARVVTGVVRPPTSAGQIVVYSEAPRSFEQIAVLDASRRTLFGAGPGSTDKVLERLKTEAAKLGANGLILEELEQTQTGSFGTGAGSESYSAHGSINLGFGGWFGIFKTTGRARAIFVPLG
jgi:murein endopeptidase